MLTDGLYQAVISIVINIELFYLNIYNKMAGFVPVYIPVAKLLESD